MSLPSPYQLRRFLVRVARVNAFFFRRGPLIALGFVLASIPAFAVDAKTIAAWLVLPAVVTVAITFVVFGVYCGLTSLITLLSRQPLATRIIGMLLSLGFGVLFAWAGCAAVYAFLSQAPLGRS